MADASKLPPLPPSPYGRFFRDGHPWIWTTRAVTAVLLLMVVGIVGIVVFNGLRTFWPRRLVRYEMKDGSVVVGEEIRREVRRVGLDSREQEEVFVRVGNREKYGGNDFRWIVAADVKSTSVPEDLLSFERMEHGPAYGRVRQVLEADVVDGRRVQKVVAEGKGALAALERGIVEAAERRASRLELQEGEIDTVSRAVDDVNDRRRWLARTVEPDDPAFAVRKAELDREEATLQERQQGLLQKVGAVLKEDRRHLVLLEDGAGDPWPRPVAISQVLRIDAVNELSFVGRVGLCVARFWRFLSQPPREANMDGGIWPAIYGTILMTLIMTIFVVPFGVLAALYLREYAKQGWAISAVRVAVNNLAGVPSIVFGVFGLGFFCYLVGGWVDRTFFEQRLPTPTFGGGGILWASLTLALLTVPVVIVSTEEALAAVPRSLREAAIACGASKWQTIRRVVLPYASPGILTGTILAMARGAGEVAPLMLTGVIKLAEDLPLDGEAPFLHPERKFMHLGFHIYDTGFQSPNVDASTPLVYSTTLVLLGLVLLLNLGAITLRNRLRKKFRTGVFG
ncbi:MAG: phosphate ABC transporter permease PstA [Planctomycetes bacterium]|nr:phosphate ABC transporter permease PstA [Planctomycetota bacterium]